MALPTAGSAGVRPTVLAPGAARLEAVDLLRGFVMVLMALDHARDFFHFGATHGVDPLDFSRTTAPLFLTRWITHYCAPAFVLLTGVGAFLAGTRGRSPRELAWFLLTRGLWLVLLEVTFVQWAGWTLAIDLHQHFALVIWAIGWSMVGLAALVHLPGWLITTLGVTLIAGHNAFDGLKPEALGAGGGVWRILHAGGPVEIFPGHTLGVGYPLIPWIGVMAAGYGLGAVLVQAAAVRRHQVWRLGLALTLAFVALRLVNGYGDPKPWAPQRDTLFTIFSFLDCGKYPPSLCYLLMTLGPALLLLALFDRPVPAWLQPILVFGRVPLFFYLLHLPLLHGLGIFANALRFGRADWLYGVHPAEPPAGAGFGLVGVYVAWLAAVGLLYPACTWFADVKRRRREAWLSYL
ncbi:MAG: DUF1624 domain-containing protein [Opitutus sp.]|nr:DUF1624 domain-containing protein [Opitutus sp.]